MKDQHNIYQEHKTLYYNPLKSNLNILSKIEESVYSHLGESMQLIPHDLFILTGMGGLQLAYQQIKEESLGTVRETAGNPNSNLTYNTMKGKMVLTHLPQLDDLLLNAEMLRVFPRSSYNFIVFHGGEVVLTLRPLVEQL